MDKPYALMFSLLFLLFAASAAFGQQFRKIDISGLMSDGQPFQIHIRCIAIQPKHARGVTHFWGGDNPNFEPSTIITGFRFSVRKQTNPYREKPLPIWAIPTCRMARFAMAMIIS